MQTHMQRTEEATAHRIDGHGQPQLRMELTSSCGATIRGSSDDFRRLLTAEPDLLLVFS